jgi:hypothetical protein
MAQARRPTPGRSNSPRGIDIPSVYYFRGIRQETDVKFTSSRTVTVGITLMTADAG